MSTKTPKRKRAAAAAMSPAEAAASPEAAPVVNAPVDVVASVSADAPIVARAPDEAADGAPLITLASNSTVKDAAALKASLLQVFDASESVAIDAKSVERIDTAIIQLLCAFVRDRTARNLAVTWRGTPQPLLDAARLLGVGALLALPAQPSEA